MRSWIVLGFIIAIPLTSGSLQPTDVPQLWAESGIDASFVGRLINAKACSSSEQYQRACLAAVSERNQTSPNPQVTLGKTVNRLLREFDPHARILPTEQLALEHSLSGGDYVGIGISSTSSSCGLLVRQIFAGSSAAAAGLQVGDCIVRIDGLEAGDGAKLSGKVGRTVVLNLERRGRSLERRLTFATVVQQFVEARAIEWSGRKFGYLHLSRFVRGACDALLNRLESFGPLEGWILDLRGNPGGLMDEAKCIAGALIGGKVRIMGERALRVDLPASLGLDLRLSSEAIQWTETWYPTKFQKTPLVLLIDHDSASSSEIVAAALQDHSRALLVGERSFGKGTAQLAESVPGIKKLSIVHTVSQFFRPSGVALQFYGVTPDISVSLRREAEMFAPVVSSGPSAMVHGLPRGLALRMRECVTRGLSDPVRWTNISRTLGASDNQLAHAAASLECSLSP